MHLTISTVQEHEDGSVTVEFDADKETKEFLLEQGFLYVMKQVVSQQEKKLWDESSTSLQTR